jgi:hypothetical protein
MTSILYPSIVRLRRDIRAARRAGRISQAKADRLLAYVNALWQWLRGRCEPE